VLRPGFFPMQHDLLKELDPIALLADAPYWIISKTSLPATDLKQLIAWLNPPAPRQSRR
jgi:hypothetical protein